MDMSSYIFKPDTNIVTPQSFRVTKINLRLFMTVLSSVEFRTAFGHCSLCVVQFWQEKDVFIFDCRAHYPHTCDVQSRKFGMTDHFQKYESERFWPQVSASFASPFTDFRVEDVIIMESAAEPSLPPITTSSLVRSTSILITPLQGTVRCTMFDSKSCCMSWKEKLFLSNENVELLIANPPCHIGPQVEGQNENIKLSRSKTQLI